MPGVLHIQRPHKHLQPAESQGAGGRRLPGALRSEVGTMRTAATSSSRARFIYPFPFCLNFGVFLQ